MTKSQLIEALAWIKDDAELHIAIPHPSLDSVMEVFPLQELRYNLQPSRVDLIGRYE